MARRSRRPRRHIRTTNELATAYTVSIASHRAIALLDTEGPIEVSRGRRAVAKAGVSDL